jgi:hypothetical protein
MSQLPDLEERLTAFREGIGGIDPVLDAASAYGRAIKEAQLTIREQGMVMKQTLGNNFNLYHTNKKLVAEAQDLRAENALLRRQNEQIQKRADELDTYLKLVQQSEGGHWKLAFEKLRKTFDQYMYDELNHDQLKELLAEQERQAKEIAAAPDTVTAQELADQGAAPYAPVKNGPPLPPRDPAPTVEG